MPIFELTKEQIIPLGKTTFANIGYEERGDLQRLLRNQIDVISPDTLVIAEEFKNWEGSSRAIDLLGIDKDANLVVIELKRTKDGGHMDLQAIRYAAMISTMTFDKAVEAFRKYLEDNEKNNIDPKIELLNFLDWDEPDDTKFGQDVKIVLASAEFSREITTAVLWLNEKGIDVSCVKLEPSQLENRNLIDVRKIIPNPEVEQYQIQIREKNQKEKEARKKSQDNTRFDLSVGEEKYENLPKRTVIHRTCKYLCNQGITPEDVAHTCDVGAIWFWIEGEVEQEKEFIQCAKDDNAKTGKTFNEHYFTNDDELIRSDGKTYALSTLWGSHNWYKAMDALKEGYPDYKIEFPEAT